MEKAFKLGQTFKANSNKLINELGMNNEYAVVIQEKSDAKNLILQTINSRKNFVEKTTPFYGSPSEYFEEVNIRPMDIMHDEICIKEHNTGTIIYGDAIMFLGENKNIDYKPIGDDLIANVQFQILSVSGDKLKGYLYCTHKPKNFYL